MSESDSERFPRIGEIRFVWLLVGLALLLVFGGSKDLRWLLLAAIPFTATCILLASSRAAARIAGAWRVTLAAISARIALALLTFVGLLVVHVFGLAAGVLGGVWLGAIAFAIAAGRDPEALKGLALRGTALALALVATIFAAEAVLGHPALARRFGAPSERAAWPERYDRQWDRNVLGLRSRHETVTPLADGGWRVIALGDSFTWGGKVPNTADTWPAQLETRLLERLAPRPVQVVNLGKAGFTTANEAELLRRLGWQFRPDLVLVQFLVNDALPSGPNFERKGGEWIAPPFRLVPTRFRQGPAGSSALLAWIEGRLGQLTLPRDPAAVYAPLYEDDALGWRQVRAALHDMGEAAAQQGVPIVLILFPRLPAGEWTLENYPYQSIYDRVENAARESGLQVIDLRQTFVGAGGNWQRWWATPYDSHPGPAAYSLAADAVFEYMSERRLLPDPAIGGSVP